MVVVASNPQTSHRPAEPGGYGLLSVRSSVKPATNAGKPSLTPLL